MVTQLWMALASRDSSKIISSWNCNGFELSKAACDRIMSLGPSYLG